MRADRSTDIDAGHAVLVVRFVPPVDLDMDEWLRGVKGVLMSLTSIADWSPAASLHIHEDAERLIAASVIPPTSTQEADQ